MSDPTSWRDAEIVEVDDADVIFEGEPMTEARAEAIAKELREKREANLVAGGKSLSAPGVHSPLIQFRVPIELRARAEALAEREGVSLSKLSRRALDEYLEHHAGYGNAVGRTGLEPVTDGL